METLRNNLYNKIEALEAKLKNFDTNEYGFSYDPESIEISDQISELETEISETWIK
jgi:hypothetical protein